MSAAHLDLELHDISAGRRAHKAGAHVFLFLVETGGGQKTSGAQTAVRQKTVKSGLKCVLAREIAVREETGEFK